MIMVTGGSFQGKADFAENRFPGRKIVAHFEEQVRECVRTDTDVRKYTQDFLRENRDAVVLMDEIGNGIVPADAQERAWREAAGRAGCILAREAEEVYRVMAGIGVRIK